MACGVLLFLSFHERGQDRRSHVAGLRCALCSARSENLGWLMPIARSMHGWMELSRDLIIGFLRLGRGVDDGVEQESDG
jgi:hypothetical protein